MAPLGKLQKDRRGMEDMLMMNSIIKDMFGCYGLHTKDISMNSFQMN